MHPSFRLQPIEVSKENPFANDNLNRKPIVEFVANILGKTGGEPLVLAVDSPYGTGKSIFVEMLQHELSKKNFQIVHFNAWKADHISDPLIAMVAALDEVFPKAEGSVAGIGMKEVKKFATAVIKRAAILGVKVGTGGFVDLPDGIEDAVVDAATDTATDLIEAFAKEEQAAKCFRIELEKVVANLPEMQKEPTLVFFIDELDRCRPDFAMSLLERIKHMFDVPNIAFVLSVDKRQLEAVTAAVYGERIDAEEYLRKFIDLEFGLPSPPKTEFIKGAIKRAGLNPVFDRRNINERDHIVRFVSVMSDAYGMSLRAIERSIVRLKLVLSFTPDDHGIYAIHTSLLIVLRSVDKPMFDKIVNRQIGPLEAMDYFRSLPGGRGKFDAEDGNILEGILIADLWDTESINAYRLQQTTIMQRQDSTDANRNNAQHKIAILDSFTRDWGARGRMKRVAATIDIAANIRD